MKTTFTSYIKNIILACLLAGVAFLLIGLLLISNQYFEDKSNFNKAQVLFEKIHINLSIEEFFTIIKDSGSDYFFRAETNKDYYTLKNFDEFKSYLAKKDSKATAVFRFFGSPPLTPNYFFIVEFKYPGKINIINTIEKDYK